MSPTRKPVRFFVLTILISAALGAALLAQPWATTITARDRAAYWSRLYWQSAFDAVSATCAVGLRAGGASHYTPAGECVMLGCAIIGGSAYLLALIPLFRRFGPYDTRKLGIACVLMLGLAGLGFSQTLRTFKAADGNPRWQAWSAVYSLGFDAQSWPQSGMYWLCAISAAGAAGCMAFAGFASRAHRRSVALWLGIFVAWIAAAAAVIAFAEGPRGRGASQTAAPPAAERFAHGLVQTVLAAGAGVRLPEEHALHELTKLTLAAVVLVGGLPGSLTGGITLPLLAVGLLGIASTLRRRSDPPTAAASAAQILPSRLLQRAGIAVTVTFLTLTLVVAGGALAIEQFAASGYQSPPTFADALLDAASAVGGAALTSGLVATLTDANLSSGMYQNVDLYPYGMTWFMLAMLTGRLAPLWLLARFGPEKI